MYISALRDGAEKIWSGNHWEKFKKQGQNLSIRISWGLMIKTKKIKNYKTVSYKITLTSDFIQKKYQPLRS